MSNYTCRKGKDGKNWSLHRLKCQIMLSVRMNFRNLLLRCSLFDVFEVLSEISSVFTLTATNI